MAEMTPKFLLDETDYRWLQSRYTFRMIKENTQPPFQLLITIMKAVI